MKSIYGLVLTTALLQALTLVSALPDKALTPDEVLLKERDYYYNDEEGEENADGDEITVTSMIPESFAEQLPEDENYDRLESTNSDFERRGFFKKLRVVAAVRRIVGKIRDKIRGKRAADEDSEQTTELLGSEKELEPYRSKEQFQELLNSKGVLVELVTRPLDQSASSSSSSANHGKQYGVVVTLFDGRRIFVVKGNKKGEGSETIMMLADHMSKDWKKIGEKEIQMTKLGKFVLLGGGRFNKFLDNGRHAVLRMMKLD